MERRSFIKGTIVNAAVAGALASGFGFPEAAVAGDKDKEKCYGVVQAGKNDCGTSKHDCAGKATKDNDPEEWVYVPKGLCEKITGASLEPKKEGS